MDNRITGGYRMSKIQINTELCTKCGTCVLICPETVFVQKGKRIFPELSHNELCFSCGHCVAICPVGAISHTDFSEGKITPLDEEKTPSARQVVELLRTRRSIRAFKDKPVKKELIEQMIDSANRAPSGHNVQSTEFVVVQGKDVLKKILELTSIYLAKMVKQLRNPFIRPLLLMVAKHEIESALHSLKDFDRIVGETQQGKDTILFHAPLLLFFHADKSAIFAEFNAHLALYNASLVCHGLGLGSFIAGYVIAACKRNNDIPELLSIPDNHQIYGALAVGYPKFTYKKAIERKPPQIIWK
jgi:nitroreductase/Pyruvate/2-oxoacid:ferredoxin oxidoreductase delta subunit